MYKGLKHPSNARALYLDMNSFFASVEQQNNPVLRNLPLGVVSHIGPAGTVLAASQEAKVYGVRTGMRLKEAWQLCPQLTTVVTGVSSYKAVHKHFMNILRDICGPEVHARSIDEAVIPLSANWQTSEKAHELAYEIKGRFQIELGAYIRCSIGIAPNSFLGKLATDLQKPNGLVEITIENTPEILSRLTLPGLPGIATRMTARLAAWGITTPLELYNTPVETLTRTFGIWGQYWWWRLHGYESDTPSGRLKSMSHQHALSHWTEKTTTLEPVLDRMSDRLIHRLRRNLFQCKQVGIFLSIKGQRGLAVEQNLETSNQTYTTLWDTIHNLFRSLPTPAPGPIRKIGVYFTHLTPSQNGYQLDLFRESDREESLSQALEKVRARHGFQSIQRGTVVQLDPTLGAEKLGFGRIRDL